MSPLRLAAYEGCKRTMDIVIAAIGIVIVSPVLLASAVAVKLSSPGPVLFKQERIGRRFQPFKIWKFRTMIADAPQRGGVITIGADPRITRVGRTLRRLKVDELPQLFNVLFGQMSLVGPRPEARRYVEMFADDYREILEVRPGITDPASIKYRNEAAVLGASSNPEQEYVERILPEKIALAREYVARRSLVYDLGVMVQTVICVARG